MRRGSSGLHYKKKQPSKGNYLIKLVYKTKINSENRNREERELEKGLEANCHFLIIMIFEN